MIGVEPEGADAVRRSREAGRPVVLEHPHSVADKLVAKSTSQLNVDLIRTYVDDVVEAFLAAGASEAGNGQVFNIGAIEPINLGELAELLIELAGTGSFRLLPFPAERKAIDIGSIYVDDRKIRRVLKWQPRIDLREGLTRTIGFYRAHRAQYWPAPAPGK